MSSDTQPLGHAFVPLRRRVRLQRRRTESYPAYTFTRSDPLGSVSIDPRYFRDDPLSCPMEPLYDCSHHV